MEISAKVLREVEFSGSLRGYNTDEVDEFLEQVALAVDTLQSELRSLKDRMADPSLSERAEPDLDESIRRTLVLAQRTADLAVKEAKDEAALLIDTAREEAESALAEAKHKADAITSEAERRLREEVIRLTSARDELKGEVETLLSLLAAEKDQLTESLEAALRYVERSLTPSAELAALRSVAGGVPSGRVSEGSEREEADGNEDSGSEPPNGGYDEVEAAIAADAAAAAPGAPDITTRGPGTFGGEAGEGDAVLDDDPWGDHAETAGPDRPTLTALPSLEDYGAETRGGGPAGWPA